MKIRIFIHFILTHTNFGYMQTETVIKIKKIETKIINLKYDLIFNSNDLSDEETKDIRGKIDHLKNKIRQLEIYINS